MSDAGIIKLLGDIAMWSGNEKLIQSAFNLAQSHSVSKHDSGLLETCGDLLEAMNLDPQTVGYRLELWQRLEDILYRANKDSE